MQRSKNSNNFERDVSEIQLVTQSSVASLNKRNYRKVSIMKDSRFISRRKRTDSRGN